MNTSKIVRTLIWALSKHQFNWVYSFDGLLQYYQCLELLITRLIASISTLHVPYKMHLLNHSLLKEWCYGIANLDLGSKHDQCYFLQFLRLIYQTTLHNVYPFGSTKKLQGYHSLVGKCSTIAFDASRGRVIE